MQLASVNLLVLDEADRLLTWGLPRNCSAPWRCCQRGARTYLATFPADVQTLAESLLKDPVRVAVADTPCERTVHRAARQW